MKFEAVLFDLDGTLLNTIDDLAESMNHVLESFGFPVHGIEAYKYFVGDGMEALVRRALPEDRRHGEIPDKALAAMREEYSRRMSASTRPYEGISELLDRLTDLGMRLAIFSNKPHDLTIATVSDMLPHRKFEQVVGARPGVPKKPDPSGALEIAGLLNIAPDRVLFLGDTHLDMQTACRAGMYPVGVLWGFRKADELIEAGAKKLIKTPLELLEII